MKKRLLISTATGAALGVICIIGASARLGFEGNELFIFATWINRVVMGLVIGLASCCKNELSIRKSILRGAVLGLIISGSLFLATDLKDVPGFFAGIVYGVIIDLVATKYGKE